MFQRRPDGIPPACLATTLAELSRDESAHGGGAYPALEQGGIATLRHPVNVYATISLCLRQAGQESTAVYAIPGTLYPPKGEEVGHFSPFADEIWEAGQIEKEPSFSLTDSRVTGFRKAFVIAGNDDRVISEFLTKADLAELGTVGTRPHQQTQGQQLQEL